MANAIIFSSSETLAEEKTEENILIRFGSGFPCIVTRGVVYSPDPSTPCTSTACNYCTPHQRLRIDPAKVVNSLLSIMDDLRFVRDLFDQDSQEIRERIDVCVGFLTRDAKRYHTCQSALMLLVLVKALSRVPFIGEEGESQCCMVTCSIQEELFQRIHKFEQGSTLLLKGDDLICTRLLLSVSIIDARALQNTQHTEVNIGAAYVEDITVKLVNTFHSFYSEKAAIYEEKLLKRHDQKFIRKLKFCLSRLRMPSN
ncbi:hypothetical protein ACJ73_03371 [Blastomyces percursus]|uniref:Uncharacterized protein n=1 Tax=Blastomyces percursus TaxID=1658174 RepID=A0A1J9QB32_9EURO|nr:hypothetical protein ACJ73_03371 [Blastomyces percursus]